MNFSDVELPSNRKFGFLFTLVFIFFGWYFFNKSEIYIGCFLIILSIITLLVTLINAELLVPLNKLWMRFGLLLGMIVSPIILGVMFFCLFTPIALFMKLFGRDELRLKFKGYSSSWKDRTTTNSQSEAFKHQF